MYRRCHLNKKVVNSHSAGLSAQNLHIFFSSQEKGLYSVFSVIRNYLICCSFWFSKVVLSSFAGRWKCPIIVKYTLKYLLLGMKRTGRSLTMRDSLCLASFFTKKERLLKQWSCFLRKLGVFHHDVLAYFVDKTVACSTSPLLVSLLSLLLPFTIV